MRTRQIGPRVRERKTRFVWLRALAGSVGGLLSWFWFPMAIVVAALVWGGPNVLFEYRYTPMGGDKYFTSCTYLGLDGHRAIKPPAGHCPYVALFPLRIPQSWTPWR